MGLGFIETFKFVMANLRAIAFAGLIFWIILLGSLDLAGLIDVQVDAPWLLDLLPTIVTEAVAADEPPEFHRFEPIRVRLTILPGLR